MIKYLKKSVFYSWIFLPIILFSILNFGNYSFLRYNFDTTLAPSYINNLKYIRIVLPFLTIFYFFGIKNYIISLFINISLKNLDVLCLIIIVIAHLFFSKDFIYPVWYIFSCLSMLIIFFVLRLFSKDSINYVDNTVKFIFVSSIIVVPFTFLSIPKLFAESSIYFSGKSAFAYFNLIMITSTLSYLVIKDKKISIINLAFILINVMIILLSGRRTPFLTSVVCLFIYLLFYSFNIKALIITFILFFLIFSNLDFFTKNFLSVQRLMKIDVEDEVLDSSYEERLNLRSYYLNRIEESNYMGIGFESSSGVDANRLSTHNTYLSVFLILGFFGLFFYILMILISLIKVFSTSNSRIIISYLLLLIPLFTINWVETNFLPGQIFYIYTMSIILYPRFIKIQ